ncbi:MAG: hypothetical protein ACRDH2_15430 [Anaerolineales bacterium]
METLFMATDQQRWGAFDPATQSVDVHPEMETGGEDLLDLTAAHTLINGGAVYAVDSGSVPDSAPLAAIFRY